MIKTFFKALIGLILAAGMLVASALCIAVLIAYPRLPSLEEVVRYQPKIPLRIYTSDGKLMGVYGEERRMFTKISAFPSVLKNAVVAAEDKRFYKHGAIDIKGIIRALYSNFVSKSIQSGASTITQQVARNFYLNNKRTYKRKFYEALLAHKIEQTLTKDEILELYFNQIYLGQRSYGFAAASMAYFNKPVQKVTLAEAAMLAGLPKAPSSYNPIVNPKRARQRQLYILKVMLDEGMIDREQYEQAVNERLVYQKEVQNVDPNSLYVAEMVRQIMEDRFKEGAYTQGFRVYTTVSSKAQEVATEALRSTLDKNTSNSGYTGSIGHIDLDNPKVENIDEMAINYLYGFHDVRGKIPALVLSADKEQLTVLIQGVEDPQVLRGSQISLARKAINSEKWGKQAVRKGSIIRVQQTRSKNGWEVTQEPELQGAIVSLDANTGAIKALVGGYDFYAKEFNRATQALRQPGSTFKPFIYSAAIQRGITPATLINDAPLTIPGVGARGQDWSPKNSGNKYSGMITLHQALVASKNVVSVRILVALGLDYATDYVQRFGFPESSLPYNYTLALGTASVTPVQMAEAYSVFANGGYKTSAYVIDKIFDNSGRLVANTRPYVAKDNAVLVIDPRNAFIMYKIMQDITRVGTAARANQLGRSDIAGKTGTTNDQKDAWFVGFNPRIVTAVYVGYDKPRNMGRIGFGGRIALPIWMDYMKWALKGMPEQKIVMPAGVVAQGGDYFLREYRQTASDIAIDNTTTNAEYGDDMMIMDLPDMPTGRPLGSLNQGAPLPPRQNMGGGYQPSRQGPNGLGSMGAPAPGGGSGGRAPAPNKNFDALF